MMAVAPLLLVGCVARPPIAEAEPPQDKFVGTTRYVDPKFPVMVCAVPNFQCKAAAPGTALTIKEAMFVYKYNVPIPDGYEVTNVAGTVGYVSFTAPAVMLTEARKQETARANAACSRRGGVDIGMTREQVYASCWGRPQTVNETVTARGKHEQFVYAGGYLYLDNGVITSIQTSR